MNFNALFNPSGQLGPSEFMTSGIVLIIAGFALNILPLLGLGFLGILGLVLLYCWIVVWIKRLRAAGQSPWMVIVVIIAWMVVGWIVSAFVITPIFAGNVAANMSTGADFASMMESAQRVQRAVALPTAIVNAAISLAFIYVGNKILPPK